MRSVEHIKITNGRARGVVLEGGEEIDASVVISNLTPQLTFLRLMRRERTAAGFLWMRIRKYRSEGTSCKINLALDGLPNFQRIARRARPAASRDHAHLPVARIRGARLGRR